MYAERFGSSPFYLLLLLPRNIGEEPTKEIFLFSSYLIPALRSIRRTRKKSLLLLCLSAHIERRRETPSRAIICFSFSAKSSAGRSRPRLLHLTSRWSISLFSNLVPFFSPFFVILLFGLLMPPFFFILVSSVVLYTSPSPSSSSSFWRYLYGFCLY